MIELRKAAERGRSRHGWLDSRHSFSFADYHDPQRLGFRSLRVINDDRVAPGAGFPTHPHRDMEIVTYVLEGAIEHRDSTGGGSVIRPGDVQRMTAGTGIYHSEFNASESEPLRLLQIWILPAARGLAPGYEQKRFDDRQGRLRLVASSDGRDGSITVHQDVALYAAVLAAGDRVEHALAPSRHAWLQVARGSLRVAGHSLEEGDGLAVSGQPLAIEALSPAELLVFDLA
jgi:quercetin 2,3-dioxygenase